MGDQLTLVEAAIKSLVVRERYYRDSCQWQNLRDCYHPDASKTMVDITWYETCFLILSLPVLLIDQFFQGTKVTLKVLFKDPESCPKKALMPSIT